MKIKKETAYMLLGIILMSISINTFFEPHNLVIGGASGLAILISGIFSRLSGIKLSLSFLFFIINVPVFAVGLYMLGFERLRKSLAATALLSLALWITEFLPSVKTDLILAAVFGGFTEGVGLGLILRSGYTTGGSDLAAIIINKKAPSLSVSFLIMIIDCTIIALGFGEFGSLNALYAIGSVYVAAKLTDIIVTGAGYGKAIYIISDRSEELSDIIMERFERGVTTLRGRGEYTKKAKNVILCVVSKREVGPLKRLVEELDPRAFMIITNAAEVRGEGFITEKA